MLTDNRLHLIPDGTEFYAIYPGFKAMRGVFLQTNGRRAYFSSSDHGIHQGSAANILSYYHEHFLAVPPVPPSKDPFECLYVAKGKFLRNSLSHLLAILDDAGLATVGSLLPVEQTPNESGRLDLLPRHCPCYIKVGEQAAWTGIAVHEAPRRGRTSGFFSDNGMLAGETAEEALEQYMRRSKEAIRISNPLAHIFLAEGPHKDQSLAFLFEHGSELAIRDCLKPPLQTVEQVLRKLQQQEDALQEELNALVSLGAKKRHVEELEHRVQQMRAQLGL
jgi:hypothetical protein